MNNWKIILIVTMLVLLPLFMGCGASETEAEQLAGAKDTAVAETEALEGAVIDAREAAGDVGEEPGDEIVTPPDDGGAPIPMPKPEDREEAKPIKGSIRMDDLVYPIRDMATGKPIEGKANSDTRHNQTTNDAFEDVWFHYSQILKGRDQEVESNIGDQNAPNYAYFTVRDGRNVFSINLTERSTTGPTVISISKS